MTQKAEDIEDVTDEPSFEPEKPDPNQCPARAPYSRCHKLRDHYGEHHDLLSGRRWGG